MQSGPYGAGSRSLWVMSCRETSLYLLHSQALHGYRIFWVILGTSLSTTQSGPCGCYRLAGGLIAALPAQVAYSSDRDPTHTILSSLQHALITDASSLNSHHNPGPLVEKTTFFNHFLLTIHVQLNNLIHAFELQ